MALVEAPVPVFNMNVGRIRQDAPIFFIGGLFCAGLIVPFWLAGMLDPRVLDGAGIWAKPLKFAVALAVYLLTLAYFARFASDAFNQSARTRWFQAVVLFCVIGELIWIGGAGMWGVRSHFNLDTTFMEGVYALMGAFAVILTSASLVYGVAILRLSAHGMPLAIGSSMIVTFAATLIVAGYMSASGGPLVGGEATGFLPFMGWARDVGDLRVPHFFATHVLHIAPMLALILVGLGATSRAILMAPTVAVTAVVAYTFLQALAGQPFLPWLG